MKFFGVPEASISSIYSKLTMRTFDANRPLVLSPPSCRKKCSAVLAVVSLFVACVWFKYYR
jgi:hypothetical protein